MKTLLKSVLILPMVFVFAACSASAGTQSPDVVAETAVTAVVVETEVEPTKTSATLEPTSALQSSEELVSFQSDVMPFFMGYCANCHGIERVSRGLDLQTYESAMKGSQNGAMIIPGDALNSPLVKSILAGKMPKKGPKPSEAEVELLIRWINQGALNN